MVLAASLHRAAVNQVDLSTEGIQGGIYGSVPRWFPDLALPIDLHAGVPNGNALQIIDAVSSFARKELEPFIREWEQQDGIPEKMLDAFNRANLFGLAIPEEYGGFGLTKDEYGHAVQALATVYPAAALSIFAAHSSLCSGNILLSSNEELKSRVLPKLASGEYLGAWGFTESPSGSRTFSEMQTKVSIEGQFLRVNGGKIFITNANYAQVIVAYGELENGEKISFVIEGDHESLVRSKIYKHMMRTSDTAVLRFENLMVPVENIIGIGRDAVGQLFQTLNSGRMVIAAHALGVMQAAVFSAQEALAVAGNTEIPAVKNRLQYMKDAYMLSAAATFEVAKLLDSNPNDPDLPYRAMLAKFVATENATRVADCSAILHGGLMVDREVRIVPFLNDSYILRIGEGSNDALLGAMDKHSDSENPDKNWGALARRLVLNYAF